MKTILAIIAGTLMVAAPPALAQGAGPQPENAPSLDSLHRALHLSAQQEAAWGTYRAQASEPNPAQDRRRAAAQMFPSLTAPQRLDLVTAEMRQELADLQQHAQALRMFYAVLTPQQQAIFDSQTLPQGNPAGQTGQ